MCSIDHGIASTRGNSLRNRSRLIGVKLAKDAHGRIRSILQLNIRSKDDHVSYCRDINALVGAIDNLRVQVIPIKIKRTGLKDISLGQILALIQFNPLIKDDPLRCTRSAGAVDKRAHNANTLIAAVGKSAAVFDREVARLFAVNHLAIRCFGCKINTGEDGRCVSKLDFGLGLMPAHIHTHSCAIRLTRRVVAIAIKIVERHNDVLTFLDIALRSLAKEEIKLVRLHSRNNRIVLQAKNHLPHADCRGAVRGLGAPPLEGREVKREVAALDVNLARTLTLDTDVAFVTGGILCNSDHAGIREVAPFKLANLQNNHIGTKLGVKLHVHIIRPHVEACRPLGGILGIYRTQVAHEECVGVVAINLCIFKVERSGIHISRRKRTRDNLLLPRSDVGVILLLGTRLNRELGICNGGAVTRACVCLDHNGRERSSLLFISLTAFLGSAGQRL